MQMLKSVVTALSQHLLYTLHHLKWIKMPVKVNV